MHVPTCPECVDGILKPDVVFFGDNVPADRVQRIYDYIDQRCDAVLIGSIFSVSVCASGSDATTHYSPTRAERQQLPNIVFKSEAHCGELLQAAVNQLRED